MLREGSQRSHTASCTLFASLPPQERLARSASKPLQQKSQSPCSCRSSSRATRPAVRAVRCANSQRWHRSLSARPCSAWRSRRLAAQPLRLHDHSSNLAVHYKASLHARGRCSAMQTWQYRLGSLSRSLYSLSVRATCSGPKRPWNYSFACLLTRPPKLLRRSSRGLSSRRLLRLCVLSILQGLTKVRLRKIPGSGRATRR